MEQTVETIGLNMILSLTDQEKIELIRMWEERKEGETQISNFQLSEVPNNEQYV